MFSSFLQNEEILVQIKRIRQIEQIYSLMHELRCICSLTIAQKTL